MIKHAAWGLVPLTLAAGCAPSPVWHSEFRPATTQAAPSETMLTGQVVSEKGPIAGALVRVAVPATDMRFNRGQHLPGQIWEARTDDQGRFRLALPANAKSAALDVLAPGYASVAGTYMSGPGVSGVGSQGSAMVFLGHIDLPLRGELTVRLVPAMYVSGTVVDAAGQPVKGVKVAGTLQGQRGYANVGSTITDAQGRFELFDFSSKRPAGDMTRARIEFSTSGMRCSTVEDLYAMDAKELQHLRVVMRAGVTLRGVVTHPDGQPAAGVKVQAVPTAADEERKETTTDAAGHFRLQGLPDGKVTFRAFTHPLREKFEKELQLPLDKPELAAKLEPVAPPETLKPVELLGMKVVEVTPELAKTYDLYTKQGVLVLDPGENPERLGIGRLKEGNLFWMVGHRKIHDLREMITELLRINAVEPPRMGGMITDGYQGNIRVVYEFGHGAGTSTQYLKLTEADARSLQELLKSLPPTPATQAP